MTPDADPRVRYFAHDGCVDYTNAKAAVFVGGNLIGEFTDELPIERDLLIAVVCREPRVRRKNVAAAFGLTTETVRLIVRRHERGGVQAIANSHRRGRPRRQTKQLEKELYAMFDAGATIAAAHQKVEAKASKSVVARTRKKWAELRAQSNERNDNERNDNERNDNERNDNERNDNAAPASALPPPTPAPRAVESREDEADAQQAACATVDAEASHDGAEVATGELDLEAACAEGGRRVQHLGTWLMVAMLNSLGLYARAEQLRDERERRSAGGSFLGSVTLRAALDAVVMALSIGKRCVEGVRWLATPSGPTLLRRTRVMSASWVRRVLARFASVDNAAIALHWGQAISLASSATDGDERAIFYVDNHPRRYTGKHTIRKVWRMQDKRASPGISDYYVHDEEGRPLARIDDPTNGTLSDWLGPTARLLREALGGDVKVLVAFDRAGAFPEHMAALRDDRLEFVTYERAPYQLLSASAFKGKHWLTFGRKRVRFVEKARKNLGKGRGRVRRIHVQTDAGGQFSVLAVSKAPAKLLLQVLFRRWSRQENQFKHHNERWGINQLDGRRVEDYPADEIIPNPARRRLDREMRIARAAEGDALRRLAALADDHPMRPIYELDLESARELQHEIEALRPSVPTHAPVDKTELAGELKRHPGDYKLVIDTLRVALANVESDLAAWLAPELPKPKEAKKTLAKLLEAPGHVRLNGRTITVTLEPAGNDAELAAIALLLARVNQLGLRLPGDPSGRTLRFRAQSK